MSSSHHLQHRNTTVKNYASRRSRSRHSKDMHTSCSHLEHLDRQELLRLLNGLTMQTSFSSVKEILHIFKRLDRGSRVSLLHISDPQARKKIRHCFRVLGIIVDDKSDSPAVDSSKVYVAPQSLRGLLKRYVKSALKQVAISLEIPWSVFKKRDAQKSQSFSENEHTQQKTLSFNPKSMSLMEAYNQGFYGPHKYTSSMFKQDDLWGKSRAEQRMTSASSLHEESKGWRPFDRERDFLHASRISKEKFDQCFRDPKNQLASRFKPAT